jgi:uncharacterized membrane protein
MSAPRHRPRQRGALLTTFALMLLVVLGFVGVALDLSRLYNRKVELQNLADAAALAQVLAVGQFFMTAPATAAAVSGEFAGVVDEQTLGGPAELYQ